jgi:hypothetical protein
MGKIGQFFKSMFSEVGSGLSGPASVPFAIFALFAAGKALKVAYGLMAIILWLVSAYQIWSKEHDKGEAARVEVEALKQKYFNERPQLGIESHSVEGPKTWREHEVPVTFTIHRLNGRVPTSIRFAPVPSLLGKFSLYFDAIPHVENHPKEMAYRVFEEGVPRPNARDMEKTKSIEKEMLLLFLQDSPPELLELDYILVANFKDGNKDISQEFKITFDKTRYRFLENTTI